jgi:hypothetical protein
MIMMEKFGFLLGTWKLDYRVPKSEFGEATTGVGTGTFRKALNDKYVYFDYEASFSTGVKTQAHAIFAWDEKSKIYRYWWFEDSGNFLTASCHFIDDHTLFLNWHKTGLVQTFKKVGTDQVILRMRQPDSEETQRIVLEVRLTRASQVTHRRFPAS